MYYKGHPFGAFNYIAGQGCSGALTKHAKSELTRRAAEKNMSQPGKLVKKTSHGSTWLACGQVNWIRSRLLCRASLCSLFEYKDHILPVLRARPRKSVGWLDSKSATCATALWVVCVCHHQTMQNTNVYVSWEETEYTTDFITKI